jgi:hypothetical protein
MSSSIFSWTKRTKVMSSQLGGVLGVFQNLLQDEMFLSIARLTDRDSRAQKNLGLAALLVSIPDANDPSFESEVRAELDLIYDAADTIRKHRHKRIAHFDLKVSLKAVALPIVTFKEISDLIVKIEAFLNLFSVKFSGTTILFDAFCTLHITKDAEAASYKAAVYDELEREEVVPKYEWKKRASKGFGTALETPQGVDKSKPD